MNKIIIIVIIIILVAIGGYFLFGKGYKAPVSGTNPPLIPGGNTENKISIKNFAFNPSTLNIKVGTTVTWTNEDSTIHRIKSDTFNSGDLNNGDSFQFTFSEKGIYDYTCAIHPSMRGTIVVGE